MHLGSIVVASVALVALAGEPDRRPYDPSRDPAKDLAIALAQARADGKRVLLEVGGNWCGWCREFDRFVRGNADLDNELRCGFVVVRVNVSPENRNAGFLSRYSEIPGYPYLFVLDSRGALLRGVDTDDFLRGETYDPKKFTAFVRKWSLPEEPRASRSGPRP